MVVAASRSAKQCARGADERGACEVASATMPAGSCVATRTEPGRTNPSVPLEALRASMAVNPKKLRPYDTPTRRRVPLIPDGPDAAATVFLVAAIVWLVAATGIGVLWAGMQLFPDLLSLTLSVPTFSGTLEIVMSPATIRAGFSNAVVFC